MSLVDDDLVCLYGQNLKAVKVWRHSFGEGASAALHVANIDTSSSND